MTILKKKSKIRTVDDGYDKNNSDKILDQIIQHWKKPIQGSVPCDLLTFNLRVRDTIFYFR